MSNSSIYQDIQSLTGVGGASQVWDYNVEIIADGVVVQTTTVNRIDYNRDYSNVYGSVISCVVTVGYTTFVNRVYPSRDALRVKIRRRRRIVETNSIDFTGAEYQTYTALLASPTDIGATAKTKTDDRPEERETLEQVDVVLQLSELAMFESRMHQVGGIFRNTTTFDLLKVLMAPALDGSQNADTLNQPDYAGIRGVDVVRPTNNIVHEHIIIPPSTALVDLPEYLQENTKGVYSSGIGYFLQAGIWHIWPLRDYTQYTKRKRTLTIVMLPKADTPFLEQSYKLNGDNVIIASTGDVSIEDNVQSAELHAGTGMRYIRASSLLDKLTTVSANKSTFNKTDTLKEVSFTERKDGLTNAKFAKDIFTDNPYAAMSAISKAMSRSLSITWTNSDHQLLYPGMPVKVLQDNGGVVKETIGILAGQTTVIASNSDGIVDTAMYSNTAMRINIEL